MSACVNKVILLGFLGKDPELKTTPNGRSVTNFTLATSQNWKTEGGDRQQHTDWFNVVAWNRLAEICKEYLHKGSRIYLEGKLQSRCFEIEEGKRTVLEVVARVIKMLDPSKPANRIQKDEKVMKISPETNTDDLPVYEGDCPW